MRKERISDEIVSLNMYNDNYEFGYLTSVIHSRYNKTRLMTSVLAYETDRPCAFAKNGYWHNSYKNFILKDNCYIHTLYDRCNDFRLIYRKNYIM